MKRTTAVAFALTSALAALLAVVVSTPGAQAEPPRIAALFPSGAKAGETVEVAVRGGNLAGAKGVFVTGGGGLTAEIVGGNVIVDESVAPLFNGKCTGCHEARSPANRTMTPEQWAATVDRMITARGAQIDKGDRDKIVGYLGAKARAGQVTAKVQVAADAQPGLREVRIVTPQGASSAYLFEVGNLPEVTAMEPNSKQEEAQKVTLPVVVNGTLTQGGERDFFTFAAKKGERIVFNLKSSRLNYLAQTYFNPVLYLYDASGKEVAKNLGRYGVDPLLDWTAPGDGQYTLLVRDLLWKGSPASVYRLTMGTLPYDGVIAPEVAAQPGQTIPARLGAQMNPAPDASVKLQVPTGIEGITQVATPVGDAPLLVRSLPNGGTPKGADAPAVALPAVFHGRIANLGQTDVFKVKAARGSYLMLYSRVLGSPLKPQVTVKNPQGNVVTTQTSPTGQDLIVYGAFPAPGEYTVEVKDKDNKGGPGYVYAWEATDGAPDIVVTAMSDCVNLAPGNSFPLLVRVNRREYMRGPIRVTLGDLPAGVTATDATIPPDDDKAYVVLTAAPNAAPITKQITATATTTGPDGATPVTRGLAILEETRINNNDYRYPRRALVVSVASEPAPFTLHWGDGLDKIVLQAGKEVKLPIKIQRRDGFKGGVYVFFHHLPPSLYIPGWAHIPGDKTEATLTLIARDDARYLKEKRLYDNLPPMQVVAVGIIEGTEYTNAVSSTAPANVVAQ